MKKYQIEKKIVYVKDEASVSFHVKSSDYFGTIATIISLIGQILKEKNQYSAEDLKTALKNLEKDLIHLQENYDIIPKNRNQSSPKIKNKKRVPKGKLNNQ